MHLVKSLGTPLRQRRKRKRQKGTLHGSRMGVSANFDVKVVITVRRPVNMRILSGTRSSDQAEEGRALSIRSKSKEHMRIMRRIMSKRKRTTLVRPSET